MASIFVFSLLIEYGIVAQKSDTYRYYFYLTSLYKGGYLYVIGYKDSTSIKIYNLTNEGASKELFKEDLVNRMQLKYYRLSPGFYLLETSKRVGAIIRNCGVDDVFGDFYTFFTSVSGAPLGTEFIFMSSTSGSDVYVVAFEDSKITLYDSSGKKVQTLELIQNQTKPLKTLKGRVYRLVSTGRVALFKTAGEETSVFISSRGTFRGRWLMMEWEPNANIVGFIIVLPYEAGKVKIIQSRYNKVLAEHTFTKDDVEKMNYWLYFIKVSKQPIKIVSTGDVSAIGTSSGQFEEQVLRLCRGITIASVPAGQEFRTYAVNKTIVFAPYDSQLEINNVPFTVSAGQFFVFDGGQVYTIKSDKPVLVELIYRQSWRQGTVLISDKDAGVILPPPKKSLASRQGRGPGMELIYIIGIALIAVIALALFFLRKKKKK